MMGVPDCPRDVPPGELPAGCRENAATPAELYARLAAFGDDVLVIPHGLAWGVHAPPGASLDSLLAGGQHDPLREPLLEIYSGHGNSEEFRDLPRLRDGRRGPAQLPRADARLPAPAAGRRARSCARAAGTLRAAECEARVEEARRLALEAGAESRRTCSPTRPSRPGSTATSAATASSRP